MNKIKKIYCDFDGTITKNDVVNAFFEKFAPSKWQESEALWIAGKISSRENMVAQVGLLPEITQEEFNNFISTIEIDEHFVEFIKFIKNANIEFVVLSDGLDILIQKTFERFNIYDIKIYSNHAIYKNNKFSVEFPYYDENCEKQSGMCKCSKIKEEKFCYIGDGTSDLCVAKKADILFASKVLRKHCETNNIRHIPFESFLDIMVEVKNNMGSI